MISAKEAKKQSEIEAPIFHKKMIEYHLEKIEQRIKIEISFGNTGMIYNSVISQYPEIYEKLNELGYEYTEQGSGRTLISWE
jgi:hypothetical protein